MNTDFDVDVEIDEVIKQKLTEPSKYKVIFFNDDATPMEWVIRNAYYNF